MYMYVYTRLNTSWLHDNYLDYSHWFQVFSLS